jgi:perosamine synthetase
MDRDQAPSPLAIEGGEPVRRRLLPYGRQSVTEADIAAVVDVLRSDWLTTGPKVEEFEHAFASAVGAAHAVACSSGTAALHAAVFAAGIGPGDEVITTSLTFCATANSVIYQGGQPIFADVEPDTLNLSAGAARARLTPRTRALMPVDYAGHPADLDELLAVARERQLVVIEDASHALGAQYRARPVGSVSHLTTFSLHPVKHLTTGEGGMVTTNDAGLARRLRLFRSHGIESDARRRQERGEWHYEMTELGFNYRLTDIGCALGLSQLPRLGQNVARRRQIAARYGEALAAVESIALPVVRPDVGPAWHLYPIRIRAGRERRDMAFRALRAEGIGVNVHYIPVHLHPYYRTRFGLGAGLTPIAEQAATELLSLPMFHGMTDADVDDTIRAVQKVMTPRA